MSIIGNVNSLVKDLKSYPVSISYDGKNYTTVTVKKTITSFIYIYVNPSFMAEVLGSVYSVTVTMIENGIGDPSSNPRRDCLRFILRQCP